MEAWVYEGEVILTELVAFYREVPSLMEKARAVDVARLAFRKAQQVIGSKKKIHAKHLHATFEVRFLWETLLLPVFYNIPHVQGYKAAEHLI